MAQPLQQIPVPGVLDRYLVFTKLNKGGMANVFLAQRLDTPGWVALKALRPKLAREARFVEMFSGEAKIGMALRHPNIALTHDFVRTIRGDLPVYFLVMEYVHGRDMGALAARLREAHARMLPEQALYLASGVLEALCYAHELCDSSGRRLDVVNKDVSPPNVMADFNGHIKLIDFGIAQATLDYRSQIGTIKGKLRYMSPEQVRGHAVDARSDLFSLSVVLYQLLTAVEPFAGETDFEQMQKVRDAQVVAPRQLNPRVDSALSDLLLRGLAKSADDRFASAREMLAAVNAARLDLPPYGASDMAAFMRGSFHSAVEDLEGRVAEAQRSLRGRVQGGALAGVPLLADLNHDTSELLDTRLGPRRVGTPEVPRDLFGVGEIVDGSLPGSGLAMASPSVSRDKVKVRVVSDAEASGTIEPSESGESVPTGFEASAAAPAWARRLLVVLGLVILALAAVLTLRLLGGA